MALLKRNTNLRMKATANNTNHIQTLLMFFTYEQNYKDTIIDLGIVHGKYPNYIIIVILTKMLLEINLNYFHF